MMANRTKPAFRPNMGRIVDSDFIPANVRQSLELLLRASKLTRDQRTALIDFANDMAQEVLDEELICGKVQRGQIAAVQRDAHRLLNSLAMLSRPALASLHAHTDGLVYSSRPAVTLPEHICAAIRQPGGDIASLAWDWIDALRASAAYTTEKFRLDKQSKPQQQLARGYVAMLAVRVVELTGRRPPKDKESWFAAFCGHLGEHLGLPIGQRLVESAVNSTAPTK